ncbi:GNAT family N-acetyltransferase [Rhizobium sp. P40RR-XXII]|uniref:GNAT family N-acetyltransferase n=1 Tax=unclassified Rhizobium TaxID=2613769 RepID=UPI0039185DB6
MVQAGFDDAARHLSAIFTSFLPIKVAASVSRALDVLENELKRNGFQQIKLRVADDNKRARHVYEVMGFRVTGINMSKPLVSK